MIYNAMPGSVIIEIDEKAQVSETKSGLFVVEKADQNNTTVAKILSVGDVRDDLKPGMEILFPHNTGLKIAKNTFYLKYEDICAVIGA